MKKYVYTKGENSVTVETDGFGSINNFMVTGLIGKDYSTLVQSGFYLKVGDQVSATEILNIAKSCKCKVDCYDGDKLVEDESEDFTEE